MVLQFSFQCRHKMHQWKASPRDRIHWNIQNSWTDLSLIRTGHYSCANRNRDTPTAPRRSPGASPDWAPMFHDCACMQESKRWDAPPGYPRISQTPISVTKRAQPRSLTDRMGTKFVSYSLKLINSCEQILLKFDLKQNIFLTARSV